MQTFKQYLTEIAQHPAELEEAIKLIQQNCKKFLASGVELWRGIQGADPILIGNSSEGSSRVSKNMSSNWYTRWLDTEPIWKDFPKRGESFICTTDYDTARAYGAVYKVFPFDNAHAGIVPHTDIWYAFEEQGIDNLSEFQVYAERVLTLARELELIDHHIDHMDTNLSNADLRTVLRSLDMNLLDSIDETLKEVPALAGKAKAARRITRDNLENLRVNNFEEAFEKVFVPNGFEHGLVADVDMDIPESREIYIQGNVVMIAFKTMRDLDQELFTS